jgi:hypothetical protein
MNSVSFYLEHKTKKKLNKGGGEKDIFVAVPEFDIRHYRNDNVDDVMFKSAANDNENIERKPKQSHNDGKEVLKDEKHHAEHATTSSTLRRRAFQMPDEYKLRFSYGTAEKKQYTFDSDEEEHSRPRRATLG